MKNAIFGCVKRMLRLDVEASREPDTKEVNDMKVFGMWLENHRESVKSLQDELAQQLTESEYWIGRLIMMGKNMKKE